MYPIKLCIDFFLRHCAGYSEPDFFMIHSTLFLLIEIQN